MVLFSDVLFSLLSTKKVFGERKKTGLQSFVVCFWREGMVFTFGYINGFVIFLLQVTRLSGIKVLGLSMGMSHTLMIVANDTPEQQQKLESFKEYEP